MGSHICHHWKRICSPLAEAPWRKAGPAMVCVHGCHAFFPLSPPFYMGHLVAIACNRHVLKGCPSNTKHRYCRCSLITMVLSIIFFLFGLLWLNLFAISGGFRVLEEKISHSKGALPTEPSTPGFTAQFLPSAFGPWTIGATGNGERTGSIFWSGKFSPFKSCRDWICFWVLMIYF